MERELVISSQLINLNKVRHFLDEFFKESCLNKNNFNRVLLGISEAVNNSIVHGNGLAAEKNVYLGIKYVDNKLLIEVKDEGSGFDAECINDPTCVENIRKESGRGIFLLRCMADEVIYFDGGRSVFIKYNLDK